MANIFSIISAVLLVAAAWVALKNKSAYEQEIKDRITAEQTLQTDQNNLKQETEKRDDLISQRNRTSEETVNKQEDHEKIEASIEKLRAEIQTIRSEIEANEPKVAELEEQTEAMGEVSEIAPQIQSLRNQIAAARDERGSQQAKLASIMSERSSTQATVAAYQEQNSKISRKESYFSSTRVQQIFPDYGFVTLGIGSRAGVVTGSTLDVVRDNATVAKLRVRSVETGRAAADLIPDSINEDITLMIGDLVKPSVAVEVSTAAPSTSGAASRSQNAAAADTADEDSADAEEEKSDDVFGNENNSEENNTNDSSDDSDPF